MSEIVKLIGGPLDGQQVEVRYGARVVTFDFEDETVERDWDGTSVYATRISLVTYERGAKGRFYHTYTQGGIGHE